MMNQEYKYLVGVECMTFNQSKYILDALNGFVMQQTNFPFVVMVVDDASTDGEQDVIRAYVNEHFDVEDTNVAYEKETDYAYITYAQHKTNKNCYFAVLYLKENHYSQRKSKYPYLSEWRDNVKYIAVCEGDDYWIHPQKLQMQVDFLEENEEYGIVHTKIKIYLQREEKFIGDTRKIIVNEDAFEELIEGRSFIATPTTLIRFSLFEMIDKSYTKENFMMGDYPLWIELSRISKIKYIDNETSVYRVVENSASHSTSVLYRYKFRLNVSRIRLYFVNKYKLKKLYNNVYKEYLYYLGLVEILQRKYFKGLYLYSLSLQYRKFIEVIKIVVISFRKSR